jgi:hypothetical protein
MRHARILSGKPSSLGAVEGRSKVVKNQGISLTPRRIKTYFSHRKRVTGVGCHPAEGREDPALLHFGLFLFVVGQSNNGRAAVIVKHKVAIF